MSSVNHDDFAHLKISLECILSATHNFAKNVLVGVTDFGNAYFGLLLWSGELIKIEARRLNKDEWGDEKEQEFWMEISLLSTLTHKNLVSLVGFCDENDERIIIIKRESRLSLSNYLSDPMLLTWVRRLEISIGIAQVLSYIHYDESRDFSLIHRNINSSSILLNDEWEPKLSFLHLSMKSKASERQNSFITDKVSNTLWYTDPTYLETNSVNHKSDIYSFGIVLFELLCGRVSIIDDDNHKYLAPLAITHYKEKTLYDIIDPNLWKQMDPQSFNIFAETAYGCLNEERFKRPDIDEIAIRLEKALRLQLERETV
ncbi:kinase-like domain-containing protein, partial [Tanacetum coccineum]